MAYPPRLVECRQCGTQFNLSSAEVEFFATRGIDGGSGLCPNCRTQRRAQFASWNSGHGLSRAGRELHTTVCYACGAETQVPFVPKEGRPVYCSPCFEKQKANGSLQ